MGWHTTSLFHETDTEYGDYLLAEDLLFEKVVAPISSEISNLVSNQSSVAKAKAISDKEMKSLAETANAEARKQNHLIEQQVAESKVQTKILEEQAYELSEQTDQLVEVNVNLSEINDSISRSTAEINYKLEKISTGISNMHDTLEKLLSVAKSPSQTWSLEQFDIARTAFDRGQFSDALNYVSNAIDGYQNNTGYTLDYRFHFLRGLIFFGDMRAKTGDLYDYKKAHSAFISAANYAVKNRDKSESFSRAGLCACAMGNHDLGFQDFKSAHQSDPSDPLSSYLLAAMYFRRGESNLGCDQLKRTFELDIHMVSYSVADPSARNFEEERNQVIKALHQSYLEDLREPLLAEEIRWSKVDSICFSSIESSILPKTSRRIQNASTYIKKIKSSSKTIFESRTLSENFRNDFEVRCSETIKTMEAELQVENNQFSKLRSKESAEKIKILPQVRDYNEAKANMGIDTQDFTTIGMLVIPILVTIGCFLFGFIGSVKDDFTIGWAIYGIFAGGIAAIVGGVIGSIVLIPIWIFMVHIYNGYTRHKVAKHWVGKDKEIRKTAAEKQESKLKEIQAELNFSKERVSMIKDKIRQMKPHLKVH